MNKDELKELKELMSLLRQTYSRLERDLKLAGDTSKKIKNLLVEKVHERKIAEVEERFFGDVLRRVREMPILRKLNRRLYAFERDAEREEIIEETIVKESRSVESKIERLKRYLEEVQE